MKKFFAVIAVAMASVMVANAQIGVVAGFGSSTTTINEEDLLANLNGVNDYHVGVAFKLPLPFGFAVQPELIYQIKGADLGQVVNGEKQADAAAEEFKFNAGFAELNVGVQWGLDLVAFRPFIFAKPFIGYQLNEEEIKEFKDETDQALSDAKNKLEYGFSIGAGLDLIEHFQLSVEFFKNLGALYNAEGEINASKEDIPETSKLTDLSNYGGIKVSLGFFF